MMRGRLTLIDDNLSRNYINGAEQVTIPSQQWVNLLWFEHQICWGQRNGVVDRRQDFL